VGVDEIDFQHRRIIDTVNGLADLLKRGDPPGMEILHHMPGLCEWVEQHFATEMSILTLTDYPDLDYHDALHSAFVSEVMGMFRTIQNDLRGVEELVIFLAGWLENHIVEIDVPASEYFKEGHIIRETNSGS